MIYYRVALQANQSSSWKWRSASFNSLETVFAFLRTHSCVPKDHMRVFFSSSPEGMDRLLARQNQGMVSNSVTAAQFLSGVIISRQEMTRVELEFRTDGDHDVPYTFTFPTDIWEVLVWTKLSTRVRSGELKP